MSLLKVGFYQNEKFARWYRRTLAQLFHGDFSTGTCSYDIPDKKDTEAISACDMAADSMTEHYKKGHVLLQFAYDSFQVGNFKEKIKIWNSYLKTNIMFHLGVYVRMKHQ